MASWLLDQALIPNANVRILYFFMQQIIQKIMIQHAKLGLRDAYRPSVMSVPLGDGKNGFALSFLLERGQEISKLLIFTKQSKDAMNLLHTLIENGISKRHLINCHKCETNNCFKQEWQTLCQRCNVCGNDCRATCGHFGMGK